MHAFSLLRVFGIASFALCAVAQPSSPVTVEIKTANVVVYREDTSDTTRYAVDPGRTTPLALRTFMTVYWIGDIVAVNGKPAKGAMTVRGAFINLSSTPTTGVGIADISNSLASDWMFDLRRPDGVQVGSIVASGWTFGQPLVGFPGLLQGALAVTGGTGAFIGMRGQGGFSADMGGLRTASVSEDPANRRNHGGGSRRYTFQLMPAVRPEIVVSGGNPMIFHADFSPVTAANPATKGEVLVAAATGLGPTTPGLNSTATFSASSFQQVAPPVQVVVNEGVSDALNQIGWPGFRDRYRVDFPMPENVAPGTATVHLIAGWIPGAAIQIPVR
jgi:hypothetical protein